MPFFSVHNFIKKIKNVTLQVRIPVKLNKRVLPYAFASMTLEAAMSLSVFLFAMICLMVPIKSIGVHRQVQAVLESSAEKFSQYAYLLKYGKESEVSDTDRAIISSIGNESGKVMVEATVYGCAAADKITDFHMKDTKILTDGETIYLAADYKMKLPVTIFSFSKLSMRNESIKRAWIGKNGPIGNGNEENQGEQENQIVYVGENATRYHVNPNCHYLYHALETVSLSAIKDYRNQDGSRYKPCSVCGKNSGETVYILPSGDKYHSTKYCSSLRAYVKAVPLEDVKHLGPCSYCSK